MSGLGKGGIDKQRAAWRVGSRVYRAKHLEEVKARLRAYDETHREERLAYREAHREELRAYGRAYREAHYEKELARSRARRKAHPEQCFLAMRRYQARKRGATIGLIDIEAIKVRDKMLCCICGKRVAKKNFSLDHSVPLSLGGPHSQENLRIAHLRCNQAKGIGRLPVQMVLI